MGSSHVGVLSIQVDLQITSRVRLVVLNFTMGADLTISVVTQSSLADLPYMYSKGKKAQLYN